MSVSLEAKIQQFYDSSSPLWEQVWGEHMHHGYYGPQGQLRKPRRQAQIDLIEELLDWSGLGTEAIVPAPEQILDVGCGIGGSSLYLAARFQAAVTGITLSPVQAQRATERAQDAGFGGRVNFQVANALQMPFTDHSFDLVWSLESGEHMPDKRQFLAECCRVLKPGGKLILATWCHRPTEVAPFGTVPTALPSGPLTPAEEQLLQQIYQVYCLPGVISLPEYRAIAETLPLEKLQTADWSVAVAPFWDVVIDSALNPQVLWGIVTAGWSTIQGALSLRLMADGYRQGLIRYGLLSGTKVST
jgi:tocopherol O-methyltransferase